MRIKPDPFPIVALALLLNLTLTGCGKKSESSTPKGPAASYPLPEPPLVADCEPGIPGGRFVAGMYGEPKTFNPITANEASSEIIFRHMFSSLLGYDTPSQQIEPGL